MYPRITPRASAWMPAIWPQLLMSYALVARAPGKSIGVWIPFLRKKPRAPPAAKSANVPTISPWSLSPRACVDVPGTSIVLKRPFSSRKPWQPPRASS
jgi:hypothetical protein